MTHIVNAKIKSTRLDIGDTGMLIGWLDLDYGGTGQGFGGMVLYSKYQRSGLNYCGWWIQRVLEIAGADSWEKLVGNPIRVEQDNPFGKILRIGHYLNDDWFDQSDMEVWMVDVENTALKSHEQKQP